MLDNDNIQESFRVCCWGTGLLEKKLGRLQHKQHDCGGCKQEGGEGEIGLGKLLRFQILGLGGCHVLQPPFRCE
jgi:hypothetical protein